MKKIITKIVTVLMALTISCASLPIRALALVNDEPSGTTVKGTSEDVNSPEYIEMGDGTVTVRVSEKNGGYYISTDEGDVISKTDNNSDLVYSDDTFDTSFASFRVTRDGKVQD